MAETDEILEMIAQDNPSGSAEVEPEKPEEPEDAQEQPEQPEEEPEQPEESGSTPFDVSKYFEGYSSIDEVKSKLEKLPELQEKLSTLEESQKTIETLQQELKQLKTQNPFKNENLFKLDRLMEKEPEKAPIYQRYLMGSKAPEELVRLKMMLDHPKLFEKNPGYLDRQIQKKYAALFDDTLSEEDEEYQDALTALEIDAEEAKKQFEAKLSEIELPKAKTEEELKKENENFVKSWNEPIKKVQQELKSISIPILEEGDESKVTEFMKYEIPEKDQQEILKVAASHIFNSRLEPTKENIDQAVKVATAVYITTNFAKINTAFANMISKQTGAKWRKKVNNPQKPGGDVKTIPPTSIDNETEILNDILG